MGRSEPGTWKNSKRVCPIRGCNRRVIARCGSDAAKARATAAVLLYGTASPDPARLAAGAAAWALVHGLVTLWLNGNLPEQLGNDPEEITRHVAAYLSIPQAMDESSSPSRPAETQAGARAMQSLRLVTAPAVAVS